MCGVRIGDLEICGETLPVTCDQPPGHDGDHKPGVITVNGVHGSQTVPLTVSVVEAVPLTAQAGEGYPPGAEERVSRLPDGAMRVSLRWEDEPDE